jgi:hypothetical protein
MVCECAVSTTTTSARMSSSISAMPATVTTQACQRYRQLGDHAGRSLGANGAIRLPHSSRASEGLRLERSDMEYGSSGNGHHRLGDRPPGLQRANGTPSWSSRWIWMMEAKRLSPRSARLSTCGLCSMRCTAMRQCHTGRRVQPLVAQPVSQPPGRSVLLPGQVKGHSGS